MNYQTECERGEPPFFCTCWQELMVYAAANAILRPPCPLKRSMTGRRCSPVHADRTPRPTRLSFPFSLFNATACRKLNPVASSVWKIGAKRSNGGVGLETTGLRGAIALQSCDGDTFSPTTCTGSSRSSAPPSNPLMAKTKFAKEPLAARKVADNANL